MGATKEKATMKKIIVNYLYKFFINDRKKNDKDLREFARIEFNKDQDYAFYWMKTDPKNFNNTWK